MNKQLALIEVGKGEHMTREKRLEQIRQLMETQPKGAKLSLKQISKFIGMSKSGHVSGLVAELVNEGSLTWEWGKTFNGLNVRLFFIGKYETWAESRFEYGEHEAYWWETQRPEDF